MELEINLLPNDKYLGWSKLKAFADDIFNVASMIISVFFKVENIVGKGENARYQHFLPFPAVFSKTFFYRVVKSGLCGKELIVLEMTEYIVLSLFSCSFCTHYQCTSNYSITIMAQDVPKYLLLF